MDGRDVRCNRERPLTRATSAAPSDEALLDRYLTLASEQHRHLFADTAQAAQLTGLTQRTIQLWIQSGALRAIRVGGKYQIERQSLREYLKSRRAGTPSLCTVLLATFCPIFLVFRPRI